MTKFTPSKPELREFYLCGIRTGYSTPRQANQAAQQWDNHVTYDCEYCPGVHHVKSEAFASEDKLVLFATEHWTNLIETVYTRP